LRDLRFMFKTHYTNSRALIIGINEYNSLSPLIYAVSDAEAVRDVLISKLGFSAENIEYLVDGDATKDKIISSFMRLAKDDVGLDERVLIYFAGHGHTRSSIRGEVGYLVPVDADINDFATFIRWDELTQNADFIRAKHLLFIMDACYGGLALTRNLQVGSARFLKDMMLRYSRQVLTAGKADQVVSDSGGPLPNHSVFTGHLLEGLGGKAATEAGVITANGLMSYVHSKVANDKDSRQTPHYGYCDGDGDFIFLAPQIEVLEAAEDRDLDSLVVLPYVAEEFAEDSTFDKIKKIKQLLANDSSSIELHDFVVEEVRRFLSCTSEDFFKVQGVFSNAELLERISKYESVGNDLAVISSCITYWAKPTHKTIIQKIIGRSSDHIESHNGLLAWLHLRWYPLIYQFYCAGIAAVEGKRYDSFADIVYTTVNSSQSGRSEIVFFVEAIENSISELSRMDVFKRIPEHDKYHTPMSEYLYKVLQPKLDDILFIGKNYEKSFDEFEVLFALIASDIRKQKGAYVRGPIGRFGWKEYEGDNAPLSRIVDEGIAEGNNWGPIKAGLFGGSIERFKEASTELLQLSSKLNWY
jgi:hypothetical protein